TFAKSLTQPTGSGARYCALPAVGQRANSPTRTMIRFHIRGRKSRKARRVLEPGARGRAAGDAGLRRVPPRPSVRGPPRSPSPPHRLKARHDRNRYRDPEEERHEYDEPANDDGERATPVEAAVRPGDVHARDYAGENSTEDPVRDILRQQRADRKSTRLNSSHVKISYAVFCLK